MDASRTRHRTLRDLHHRSRDRKREDRRRAEAKATSAAKMVLLKVQRVLDDRPDAPERQREAFRLVRLEGHALVASEKQRLLGQ